MLFVCFFVFVFFGFRVEGMLGSKVPDLRSRVLD